MSGSFAVSPSVQSPSAWDRINLTRAGMRTRLADSGYRFKIHPAETTSGLVDANLTFGFDPGDLRRYGVDLTGGTDNATQIASAILAAVSGGWGYIYHPGGNIRHNSTITLPNGVSVYGSDRTSAIFTYVGTGSAWRNVNGPNSSGYGRVIIRDVQITTASASNTGAALELNSGGFAFYEVERCRLSGSFKYDIILDGTEVAHIENNILELTGIANSANIWIVNGSGRSVGQVAGFTNSISIHKNQINGGFYGIADDGGSNHYITDNNLNGNHMPIRMAGVVGFELCNNEVENALGGAGTEEANFDFLTLGLDAVSVGACQAGLIKGNFIGADMGAGGCSVKFGGASFHQCITVENNWFRNNSGRVADIDVTKLSNSFCGRNFVDTGAGGNHYTGTHNDASGNTLWPPQNGSAVGFTEASHVYGDTRYPHVFHGGVDAKSQTLGGLSIDAQKWQNFTLRLTNTAGTIQHAIFDNALQGTTPGYADRILGNSSALANTPTITSGVDFTNGVGLISGATSHVMLKTAAAVSAKSNLTATIVYYDGNVTRLRVYIGLASRNINGVTQYRPELAFTNDMTGAAVNIDTTLLPAGKILDINISGYIA